MSLRIESGAGPDGERGQKRDQPRGVDVDPHPIAGVRDVGAPREGTG